MLMNSSTILRSPKDTVPLGSAAGGACLCAEREESDFEISNQDQCSQVFGSVARMQRWIKTKQKEKTELSDTVQQCSNTPTFLPVQATKNTQPVFYQCGRTWCVSISTYGGLIFTVELRPVFIVQVNG